MISREVSTLRQAVSPIKDSASIFIGGFGEAGSPIELIHALIDHGVKDLTIISNNAGNGYVGLAALINNKQVKKIICSFPRSSNSVVFSSMYQAGEIELEIVPQGNLAARIQAGGAGIPAFYTPTGVGTLLAEGKEIREFNGKKYIMEESLKADFALIKAEVADTFGNLTYNKTARNFSPIMCTAANYTIVQAKKIVAPGKIDPETVITPHIFVNAVINVTNPDHESDLIAKEVTYP
jgi:3-oxoadipate CoA-transferase alpha subunit